MKSGRPMVQAGLALMLVLLAAAVIRLVAGEGAPEVRLAAVACLLPTRGFVRILNAAGKDVSGFAYTTDYRFPVSAEPGKTFSTPFTGDQKDCSGSACVQVAAGTYTVVADWTEGGPYTGRGSFTIGG